MARRRAVLWLTVALLVSGLLLASAAKPDAKDAKDGTAKKKKAGITAFVHEGKNWRVHQADNGRAFYYNVETGQTQWNDPRVEEMSPAQKQLILALVAAPVLLSICGGVGYIYWVKKTRPELLKGPKKVKGLKNWERALIPPKVAKPKDRARSASPPPPDATADAKKDK